MKDEKDRICKGCGKRIDSQKETEQLIKEFVQHSKMYVEQFKVGFWWEVRTFSIALAVAAMVSAFLTWTKGL